MAHQMSGDSRSTWPSPAGTVQNASLKPLNILAAEELTGGIKELTMAAIWLQLTARICVIVSLAVISHVGMAQEREKIDGNRDGSKQLALDQILKNLQERNAQRAATLEQFEGRRIYKMHYQGFPTDRDAEMVVKVRCMNLNSKEFSIESESGSKFVIDRVFKKLLDAERQANDDAHRREIALTTENYNFTLAGFERTPEGGNYVLNLVPKAKSKFLYRGKIWIDSTDFAVARIEGEPETNPSIWIKKTKIAHRYIKVDGFWLPAENQTESVVRLGGKATLSIEYRDYKIIKAVPSNVVNSRQGADSNPIAEPRSIAQIVAIAP